MKTDNGYSGSAKRFWLEALGLLGFIALILLSTATYAQSMYCDSFGNCTGSGINTYTDSFGNTTGTIGGQPINCYTDSFGNTSCR